MVQVQPDPAKGFQGKIRWPLVRIGEVANLHYGRALVASSRSPGSVRVYGSNGQCGWHNKSLGAGPTVILGRKGQGPLGVEWCLGPFWVIDTAYYVSVQQERIDIRYFYFLTKYVGLNHLKDGTSNPSLSRDVFGQQGVPLPSLPVQQRIADILSNYDELIENSQQRIKILESMVRALYREWFVHFRFPGHENYPRVASRLGEIPQGWEVKTVEEIVKRIPVGKKYDQKTVSPTGVVPVLDQGKSGVIGYHNDQPSIAASENAPVIVFANHTCYQRLIHFPFSAIQNVLPFVPHPSTVRNIYWLHWATNGLIAFNGYKGHWPEFSAKQLVVPPEDLCNRFGDFCSSISRQILKLECAIDNLRRTRDLLLPRLLSGQIEVEAA